MYFGFKRFRDLAGYWTCDSDNYVKHFVDIICRHKLQILVQKIRPYDDLVQKRYAEFT